MGVNTGGLAAGLASAGGMLKGFQSGFGSIGAGIASAASSMVGATRQAVNQLGLFGVVAGGVAAAGIYKLVMAGSDAIETQNLIKETFKGSSGVVIEAANQMAGAFGTSKREFLQASGMLGGIFKNAGYTTDAAAGLSVEVVKLAGDLASFKNLSFEEALNKITAGITGESEPLKRVGINLLENTVKQEAYRMGIAKVGAELTEQQKVQARLSSLSKQTADAQGDLARTADDVANSTRGFQGRVENLIATMGEQLQPLAASVFGELNMAIQAGSLMWADYMNSSVNATAATVGGSQQQVESMGWIQKGIGFITDAWYVLQVGFKAVQSYITAGLATIVDGLLYLSQSFDAIAGKLGLQGTGATEGLKAYSEELHNLSNTQWEGLQEKLREPWPSESINDYFAQAKAKTDALRTQMGGAAFNPNQFTPQGADVLTKAGKDKEMKFAGAAAYGSSDAANTILRSAFSSGMTSKEQANKKTAENTGKMVRSLEDIAKSVSDSALMTSTIANFA